MRGLDNTPRENSRRINDFINIGIYGKNACYSSSSWLSEIICFCRGFGDTAETKSFIKEIGFGL